MAKEYDCLNQSLRGWSWFVAAHMNEALNFLWFRHENHHPELSVWPLATGTSIPEKNVHAAY